MAKTARNLIGFHGQQDTAFRQAAWVSYRSDTQFTYTFENFYHPFVGELVSELNKESLSGMLDPTFLAGLTKEFFDTTYTPPPSPVVQIEHSPREIDLADGGPYANYNWELLFHIPLTIAVHLSKNQRFAEAQRWFHFIFDPTCNDTSLPTPRRFWKFLDFRSGGDITRIDQLLALLSKPNPTPTEIDLRDKVLRGYQAIQDKPFMPHAVARTRHLAYQYAVVMRYLDNLIAWGDSLFRQDTVEAINEATQRYVLAANLLGARPQRIPPRGTVRPQTYAELKQRGLDPLGNALVDLEGQLPFNLSLPEAPGTDTGAAGPLFGIGRTFYFSIPRNEKMLGYWDTVADRLFKIRHCMNIEGVVRQLALFDPPIDPGLLVKAAAAGIDLGAVVSGLNQPVGPVRSLPMLQKALELSSEVRGLGSSLLAALEKQDGEQLALLRQGHELKIQQLTQEVRFLQWKQAQESTQALLRSRTGVLERYHYYQRLLGLTPDGNATPDTFALDRRALTEETFDEAYAALVGQYDKAVATLAYPALRLAGDAPAQQSGAAGAGQLYLNRNEDAELNRHLPSARDKRSSAGNLSSLAAVLTFIPEFDAKLAFWGLGAGSRIFGGSKMSDALKIAAGMLTNDAAWEQDQAGIAARTAGYERRADDWRLQSNLAARDLMHIGRQLLGSLIAEQISHREYLTVQQQIAQAQEVDTFLREKFTSVELYGWMQGEISRLYYEYYRFAFDTARKAEQTLKRELMRPELDATPYVKFNYWDGGRKGLLSGEALHLDLKRLELAYHEHNKREYELTKHVSLRQLNPVALLALKATGTCAVSLPEWLFDLDAPGHYLRRLKQVSLSIPAVTGPYTSVNCTLTLEKSSLRKSPLLAEGEYARQGSEDPRFVDYFGSVQSMVTSSGNSDSGLFETNLHDERWLPFEGAGAASTWKLELPANFRQFDYNTISDVVLHVRYTARSGGSPLRDKAVEHLLEQVAAANASGLTLLVSLAHDFPDQWHKFATSPAGNFTAKVPQTYFPYFTQGQTITIDEIGLRTITDGAVKSTTLQGLNLSDLSTQLQADGGFDLSLPADATVLRREPQREVFLVIKYAVESN